MHGISCGKQHVSGKALNGDNVWNEYTKAE